MSCRYGVALNRIMASSETRPVEEETRQSNLREGSAGETDATGASDISYYHQRAFAKRLTVEASRHAQRARREAILLIPLIVGVVLLWRFREDIFGTDTPVRVGAAIVLAAIGWRFARDVGRALGPRILSRADPGTASTVSFLVQLVTLVVVVIVALRIMDVETRAIALGGAITAVVLGLAAQNTLGNVIAGMVLLSSRPFRVGERVRLQGGSLGAVVEGTVASIGLVYTTIARGNGTIMVPNNGALSATVVPLRDPAGVNLRARLREDVKPSDLQRMLDEKVRTPTRDRPDISLEEIYADGAVVRITATPVADADGGKLADEVLAVVSAVAADAP
jgi:small conductance mechanosensitive channel